MTLGMSANMTVMVYREWWGVSYTPWRGSFFFSFFSGGGGGTSLGGEEYHCPYGGDGLVCDGAAKGLAVGGGVDFFVDAGYM